MYSTDLAHIHHAGFGAFARRAGPQIAAILRRHGVAGGTIVEIGCGSGITARSLTDRGFRVVGYDVSPAMVRLARARAPAATFRVGSLETLPIPACDAIVSVGEVVSYVPGGLPALRRFFRRAYDALRPGGLLVFDFMASARGRTYEPKTIASPGWRLEVGARFDPSTGILTRRMRIERRVAGRIRRSRETHRVRVHSCVSIVSALRRCGFTVGTSRSLGRIPLLASDLAVVARKVPHV